MEKILIATFIFFSTCGCGHMEEDIITNDVNSKITEFLNTELEKRREDAKYLSEYKMNDKAQEFIGEKYIEQLVYILKQEKDPVVKYYLITFIGNLGKYAKSAITYLEDLSNAKEKKRVSKSYKTAIPLALQKIRK